MVGKAKFSAWSALGAMDKEEAMRGYIKVINELVDAQPEVEEAAPEDSKASLAAKRDTLHSVAFPRSQAGSVLDLELKAIKVSMSDNNVLTVTLNRPNRGNSFNIDMWNDLRVIFETCNLDSNIRAVIITGNEKSFSTGMDLSVFEEMDNIHKKEPCEGRKRESMVNVIRWLQESISGPEKCVVPVIAAISGQCIGGAVDLATACDLRYCTNDAVFSIKETNLAMVADIGTLQRLPKLIGDSQARELTYTGRDFGGTIAQKSPLTIRGIKSTMLYTRDHSVEDSLNQVQLHNAAHLMSADLMVAMTAAFMKDTPVYKGA
eukprot:GSChrysophyteH1.ASY1.ANO1.2298.1 assembled CDS